MIYEYTKYTTNKKTGRKNKIKAWYVHGSVNGRQFTKKGFLTKEDAIAYELTLKSKSSICSSDNRTINELFNLYINHLSETQTKLRTIRSAERIYNARIKKYFGDLPYKDLTVQKIRVWQNELLKLKKKDGTCYRNKTLEGYQNQLITIINFGYSNGYITKPFPFKKITIKNEEKREMDFYTIDEFNKFISVVDKPKYKAFFNVLYFCGLRKGEAMALTWQDIDFKKRTMNINKSWDTENHIMTSPKTSNSYRTLLIPDRCLDSLTDLYNMYKINEKVLDKNVFGYFKPISVNSIDLSNRSYAKKAEVKHIRIHDFRHSHVSLLINKGFSAFDISKRLGHTVEMVLNVYSHWFIDSQEKMLDFLNTL